MPPPLSSDRLRAARQRAQLLIGPQPATVRDAVRRLGAVQAQLPSAARLALRARTAGATAGDVDQAWAIDRSVVCTWVLRGTLHLVAATDVHWMVDLLGPLSAAGGRRRRERLGLDASTCERGVAAISEVLHGSAPLSRADLVTRIAEHGVRIDPRTQAPAHLVAYAANSGVVCRGPDLAGEATYVLLDEWVPRPERIDRDDALAELARRYLAAHAPASVADFMAWSGLPAADGHRAFGLIAGELATVDTEVGPLHTAATGELDGVEAAPPRLLGHFDPLLLGYRSRELLLDAAHATAIQAGGGFVRPAVLAEGRVAGSWRLNRTGTSAWITVEPFDCFPPGSAAGLEAEAADIGRFLGQHVPLRPSSQ